MSLRHVDPRAKHGRLYRAYAAFSNTPIGRWLSTHVMWKIDPYLLKLTRGRVSGGLVLPTALLETRGARSGKPRSNAVLYFHDGDRVTLVASKLGLPEHPAWFHNARANPDVVFGGRPFRAEVVSDEQERERLFALADNVFPPFEDYRRRAAASGRTVPILQLSPA